jgi:hypothetical protein
MTTFFDSIKSLFVPADSKLQKEFEYAIEPLESRQWSHFNWSAVLFVDGLLDAKHCLSSERFKRILQHNELEPLLVQMLSLMFVAADRCKESSSPKAQQSLRNGLVLIVSTCNIISHNYNSG